MASIVNYASAWVTISIFIALFTYIAYRNGIKNKITLIFGEIALGSALMSLPYVITYASGVDPLVDCYTFRMIILGILMAATGMYHLVVVFPRKLQLYYSLPSVYILSYFMAISNLATPSIVACGPTGGVRGVLWPMYLIWAAAILLISVGVIHYSMVTAPTRVQKIQSTYIATGMWITLLWAGAGQLLPTFIPGMEYFSAISALPIAGIFLTIAIVKYKMFSYEVAKEKFIPEEKIEVEDGLINAVINEHAAFLAFRRLSAKMPGLIITIKPPNVIRERYKLEKSPIIWLTYFPGKSEEGISPDKLAFEVMYNVINFVNKGGKLILIHGAEFLVEQYGREYFLDFLHEVNRLADGLTIIVALNTDKELMEGIADNFVEVPIPIPDPRVRQVTKEEMQGRENMIIITAKTQEQIKRIYGENNHVIELTKSFTPDRLVFEGMDKIIKIGDRNVFFESFDFVLSSTEPKKVMQFLKDIIDVSLRSGNNVYVMRTPRLDDFPAIKSLLEDLY